MANWTELHEVVYRMRPSPGVVPTQLPLILAARGEHLTIETTVAHLDDDGMVWRTLGLHGPPSEVAAARSCFDEYRAPHLVEKQVLGAAPGRLILWYKYKPRTRAGPSHTALAFRLLGRDTVVTDQTQRGELTVRLLGRAGPGLQEFLRTVRATPGMQVRLLYSGPPRDSSGARLAPAEEEALAAAHRLGYYDVPRTAAVRQVGRALGVAATTASYRLRRAEGKLVAAHLQVA